MLIWNQVMTKIRMTHVGSKKVICISANKQYQIVPWEQHFNNANVKNIQCINVIEHFTSMEADATLRSIFDSLNINGSIFIKIKNLDYYCKLWLNADWTESTLKDRYSSARIAQAGIFGEQNNGNPLNDNYNADNDELFLSGYNEKKILLLLSRIGFVSIRVRVSKENIFVRARKTMHRGERQIAETLNSVRGDHLSRYDFAIKTLQKNQPEKILDLACGVGYGTSMLAEYYSDVIGVDIDLGAIEYAKKYYQRKNNRFICADAKNISFNNNEFDAIISFETIEHIDFDLHLIKFFHRILKPSGLLICSTPNEDVMPFNSEIFKFHIRHYKNHEFISLLQRGGFSNISLFQQKDAISAPVIPGHDGCFTIAVAERD